MIYGLRRARWLARGRRQKCEQPRRPPSQAAPRQPRLVVRIWSAVGSWCSAVSSERCDSVSRRWSRQFRATADARDSDLASGGHNACKPRAGGRPAAADPGAAGKSAGPRPLVRLSASERAGGAGESSAVQPSAAQVQRGQATRSRQLASAALSWRRNRQLRPRADAAVWACLAWDAGGARLWRRLERLP